FAAAGVPESKLVVVPESIDCRLFDPDTVQEKFPLPGSAAGTFAFLSVFKWEERKGWDILVRAFAGEFASTTSSVRLYLRTGAPEHWPRMRQQVLSIIMQVEPDERAAHLVLERIAFVDRVAHADYPRLYRAADAFVLPTRGEGWGRPILEAMGMGLPVIATNWSGPTHFMSPSNSYPIAVDRLEPAFQSQPQLLYGDAHQKEGSSSASRPLHEWARPHVGMLRRLMREVYTDQAGARIRGEQARQDVRNYWCKETVARIIRDRLITIVDKLEA
ncbi:hypothetical protein CYMTET_21607, partial [Cymbomonas tetramitiformis]